LKKILLISFIIFISCEPNELEEDLCDPVNCDLICETFFVDENGCELCQCIVLGCTDIDATNFDNAANTDDESCIYNYVYAGIHDENFIITEFSPNLEIEIVWDDENMYGFGNLSLDIDQNGIDDLIFNLTTYNPETFKKLFNENGSVEKPYYFPSTGITPSDNIEVAFIEVGFYAGLGSYSSNDFVYKINYEDRIDNLPLWKQSYAPMFQENPTYIFPFGPWYSANGTYYIGIKKENKFGWIEIEMNGLNTFPKISKIAFQTFGE